jgi:hypothetical protein
VIKIRVSKQPEKQEIVMKKITEELTYMNPYTKIKYRTILDDPDFERWR